VVVAGKKKPANNAGKQQVEGSNLGNSVLLSQVLSKRIKQCNTMKYPITKNWIQ
jgi:hypothetical protein